MLRIDDCSFIGLRACSVPRSQDVQYALNSATTAEPARVVGSKAKLSISRARPIGVRPAVPWVRSHRSRTATDSLDMCSTPGTATADWLIARSAACTVGGP